MQQRLSSLSPSIKMGSAGRSNKSMRVSWASEMSLCQVRLFLSEDAPSQSGLGAQDLLQAKASWLWHSTEADSEDQLPPGFEGPQPSLQSKKDAPQLPIIKWRCPPSFVLNPIWQVAAGEESVEMEVQNQRELRVLEAVYPRPSSIPPSPSSPELSDHHHSDLYIPIIPITPIEDDDVADLSIPVAPTDSLIETWEKPGQPKSLPDSGTVCRFPVLVSQPEQSHSNAPSVSMPPMNEKQAATTLSSVEQDVAEAAASVVFTAIMTSNREGSLIDRDLLIKLLKNPKLMEELVKEHGTSTGLQTHVAKSQTPSIPVALPSGQQVLPASVHGSRLEVVPISTHAIRQEPLPVSTHSIRQEVLPASMHTNRHELLPAAAHVSKQEVLPAAAHVSRQEVLPAAAHVSRQEVLPASALSSRQEVLPASFHVMRTKLDMPMPTVATTTERLYPRMNAAVSTSNTRPESLAMAKAGPFQAGPAPPVKDANYYKSLIRQHGEEKHDIGDHDIGDQTLLGNSDHRHGPKFGIANSEILQRELRYRVQKPCVYYNSPRGCRNGANCIYQHDGAGHREMANVGEVQNSKRIKLEREITGSS